MGADPNSDYVEEAIPLVLFNEEKKSKYPTISYHHLVSV
tara:strand:+ start:36 stop:152 length:117 start_codon:yes stop_codon:yes gene_type:complete